RYQMLAVPDTTGFGGEKIVILDAVGGHVWTWSEHAATPGGPGGRFSSTRVRSGPAARWGMLSRTKNGAASGAEQR
ncbi:MAG: hypothetical protein ACR2MC_01860, partial [Actinomycetota bacterium]